MQREKHTFEFPADAIARAARAEAEYHETRQQHWSERFTKARDRVEQTIGAKLTEHQTTSGSRVSVVVDYGDREAWQELQLADEKKREHEAAAERYRTDERVYETQGVRPYQLDTEDVHHFRLGGRRRDGFESESRP